MHIQHEKIFTSLLFLIITAIFLVDITPLPLSICMALIFITPFFYIKPEYIFKNLKNNKFMLMLMMCFLVLVPSVFYSKNYQYLFERWQINIPFLLLPIAFANSPKITRQLFYRILLWLALHVFIICFIAIIYYIFNTEQVHQRYLESQVMPTILTHHPTFSILIAFSIYIIYYTVICKRILLNYRLQYVFWGILTFLFIFQHIYSVRIGLLALYLLVVIEIARLVFITKQYIPAIIGSVIIIVIAYITITYSPTVQNKIKNTQADIVVLKQNQNATHHSLAMRLISYKIAIKIILQNPILGVGLGNFKDELEKQYETTYPEMTEKKIIPHNMFLFLAAAIGLIGACLYLFGLFYGYLFNFKQNPHLLNIHYLIVFFYTMIEAGTQTQLGVAYILIPILIGLKTIDDKKLN